MFEWTRIPRVFIRMLHTCEVVRHDFKGAGLQGYLKRRKFYTRFYAFCANAFLSLCGTHQRLAVSDRQWQQTEVLRFRLLHGDQARVRRVGRNAIWIERLGEVRSIREWLRRSGGSLDHGVLFEAAGRELARAHGLVESPLDRPFIHGDPHCGNLVYCPDSMRAWLIDFETLPKGKYSSEQARSEDIAIFLIDLMRELESSRIADAVKRFFVGYGPLHGAPVIKRFLVKPQGVAAILWWTRVQQDPGEKLDAVLEVLESLIAREPSQSAI